MRGEGAVATRGETRLPIGRENDIVTARQKGRELAALSGLTPPEQTLIATAISEVARNIVVYAHHGEVVLAPLEQRGRRGVLVIARDDGPGIANLELAMGDGFSASRRR